MKPYSKSKDAKKIKVGKFYIMVTTAVIVAAVVSLYADSVKIHELMKERSEIIALTEEEEKKQINISSEKHYFESDSYIEEVARKKLGLVKPNDVIFIDRSSK